MMMAHTCDCGTANCTITLLEGTWTIVSIEESEDSQPEATLYPRMAECYVRVSAVSANLPPAMANLYSKPSQPWRYGDKPWESRPGRKQRRKFLKG